MQGSRPACATLVLALGGNAILRPGQRGSFEEQYANVRATAEQLVELLARGYRLVVTHGNGPQVGNVLLQNEEAAATVPPMPLHACGAMTQGLLGYMLQQALGNAAARRGLSLTAATVITQVLVRPDDPAFAHPAKPVGPFYDATEARRLAAERGYHMREDAGRGWRRVVPSPEPVAIRELSVIRRLLAEGIVVIAAGGGGIPVRALGDEGDLAGVDAVIDKDLAAARLATELGADGLFILTDVEAVALDWGTPRQRSLGKVSPGELRRYQAAGHFARGSMGPKVEAVLRFVEAGGSRAAIGALHEALAVVEGRSGTQVVPEPAGGSLEPVASRAG
ncbi:MAG TPA: carbamate kinase [Thermaerobacter sp.]